MVASTPTHRGRNSDTAINSGMEHDEFTALAKRLRSAAAAYYAGDGSQLMDDAIYDAGIRALRGAAAEHG